MGKISAYYVMPHPPIIIPEIGRGEESKISNTIEACESIAKEIQKLKPATIVLVTPHGPLFSDAVSISYAKEITGSFSKFGSNLKQSYSIDTSLTKEIIELATKQGIACAVYNSKTVKNYNLTFELDHGAMVPLYFVNKYYTDYRIVHITYGMLPKLQLYKFGMCLKEAIQSNDLNTVFIASGDLSHKLSNNGPYKYSKYGPLFDNQITKLLKQGDVKGIFNMDQTTVEQAGECGLRSIYIMLGCMNGSEVKGKLLSYQDTFGVGYGVMSFDLLSSTQDTYGMLISDKKRRLNSKINNASPHAKLARESLLGYLLNGNKISIPDYITKDILTEKRGVFVSLKKEGQLRGCIGTFMPTTENIATEIVKNAIQAGLHDPRFLPVTIDELDDIDFSVDVLTEPKPAVKEQLDPKIYGVIVRKGTKAGLLLPDLDGVNTVEQQLDIALKKAGIKNNDNYTIESFEVIRHK